ncbi:MAG: hypothetical protein OEO77_12515 [Acidimicrobiia bacterium]|nr:hypothetical protein [Acidimicrobiia bacterium]
MADDPFDDFEDIIPDDDDLDDDDNVVGMFDEVHGDEPDTDMFEKVVQFPGAAAEPIHDPLDSSSIGQVDAMLQELIVQLQAAKTMPLSSNVLVDKNAFIANLERLRAIMPEELRQARWMIREREAFMSRANEKAREITDKAQVRSNELVSQSHVLAEAVEEANILVRNAEAEARKIRLDAEDYSEDRLVQLEHLFGNLLKKVRDTRAEFHQARPASPEPPISR